MILYVVIAIIAVLVIYLIVQYNAFVKANNIVKEAFSTMDVYLKKRWDLIPNLVETVKSYAKYESDTLENVIKLRNTSYDDMSYEEKIQKNQEAVQGINKLIALSENYPEIKANENFIELSNQLTQVENEIANSRKYYNATVREYNNKIGIFPNNIVAKLFNHKEEKMFSVSENERDNVKVNLNK